MLTVASAAVLILFAAQAWQLTSFSRIPPWPHQQALAEAGDYLRANPPGGRVGAWNAGIVGYHEGGSVINLDGLVNNDAAAFAQAGRLASYVDATHIAFVVDDPLMLEVDPFRLAGYDDRPFLARL